MNRRKQNLKDFGNLFKRQQKQKMFLEKKRNNIKHKSLLISVHI